MRRLLLSVMLLLAPVALATTWRVLDLEGMLAAADTGFHGTVSQVQSELRDGQPWTLVTFELQPGAVLAESLLEDSSQPDTVTLAFLGGSVAATQLVVEGMPQFTGGTEVLLLAYEEEFYSPVVGFSQALWQLHDGMWRALDGSVLTLDEDGNLQVGDEGDPADVPAALLAALEAR